MPTTTHYPHRIIFPEAERIDLHALMRQVYMWMGLGTLITALVAFMTIHTDLLQMVMNPIVLLIALVVEIALVLGISFGIQRLSTVMAIGLFMIYAAVNGFTLSLLLLTLSIGTIGTAFLATAMLFGVMSVFSLTTRMDFSGMGIYLMMGVIGLIIAMVLNLIINSGPLDMLISMMGVLIFTGLTAYDTQRIGRIARQMKANGEGGVKLSIIGALTLYLDFINLFFFMLRLMGNRRR